MIMVILSIRHGFITIKLYLFVQVIIIIQQLNPGGMLFFIYGLSGCRYELLTMG